MAITCRECIDQLAPWSEDLLSDEDAEIVAEHVESCPRCRLFTEQIDATVDALQALPLPDPPLAAMNMLRHHVADDGDIGSTLERLYRLAESLDPEQADDLVQETLLAAIQQPRAAIAFVDLARELVDRFIGTEETRTVSSFDEERSDGDPDSETSELFYPEFYEDGPDAGRFVGQPNTWGIVPILAPDVDVETGELFDVVEAALADLPRAERSLVELVDVDGVAFSDAAAALRLDAYEAALPLARGRVHVRGALDQYFAP